MAIPRHEQSLGTSSPLSVRQKLMAVNQKKKKEIGEGEVTLINSLKVQIVME